MALSTELLSQFAKVTKDETKTKSDTTVYGTVVEQNGVKYVQIDGSDLLTPISSTTNVEDKERVTVMIKNHMATVTGNISSPAARTAEVETTSEAVKRIEADYVKTKDLEAEYAKIENLDATYANIDFTNIGTAAMEYFYANSGLIKDVVVGDQTITGELVGVTIRGDRIIGETVIADKLVIKGEDGLFYKLNTDGMSVEAEQTNENSLNGSVITAKSITATKISVTDLVAFDATIGGFKIGETSIHSGVKESVDNTTQGLYLGSDGQMALGDGTRFLKYYKDTDGTYKLAISADSFVFSSDGRSVADAINDIQIGGTNYLLNSGVEVSNAKYAMVDYPLGDPKPTEGETYTLRLWGQLGSDREYFHAYNSSNNLPLTKLSDNNDGTYSATFTWKNSTSAASVTPTFLRIYQRQSSGTTESTITRIKLEAGNKATDWSPAPEDVQTGNENLLDDAALTISNGWIADDSSWHARNGKRIGFGGSGQDSSMDISANFGEIYITPGSYTVSCYAWQWNLGGAKPTLYFDMHSPDRTTFAQNVMATTLEDTASGGVARKYTGTLNVTGYTGLVSIRFIVIGSFSQGDIGITEWKLERGNNATEWSPYREQFSAGTNVLINKDRFSVTTPEMNVNITSADGTERMLTIDKNGIHAQSIDCPNVAQRYDGPTTLYVNPDATSTQVEAKTHFRSLGDLAEVINNKIIHDVLTVNLSGNVGQSKVVTFRGIQANTWITLKGTSSAHAKLVGKLQLYFNSAAFRVQYLDIDTLSSELIGVEVVGRMQNAEIQNCVITGRGDVTGAYGINVRDGAMVNVSGCELYDLRRSLRSADGGLLVASNSKGNCSPGTNLANMHLSGTQACSDASTWTEYPIGGEIYKYSVTINQGSKPTPEPEATSVSYTANSYDTWASGGWNVYSNNDDIYQGYTSALGEHRGCFWFDNTTLRSDLNSKTIKQATLSLYQISGVGRNQSVQVSLEGITVSYGGSQPYGNPEYGVIGTTLGVNQTTTFTIPTTVITDLVAGTINGFMLRTGETSVMTGDDNSYNYARFVGESNSSYRPKLTITYA